MVPVLIAILFILSCSQQDKAVVDRSETIQIVEVDGQQYRLAAGKANQADLNVSFHYSVRGGQAYVDFIKVDGVEFRADCKAGETTDSGSSVPHFEYCEDGVGRRDVDFTCDGLRNPPPPPPPLSPDNVRLKVEGNEAYLYDRFSRAIPIEILPPPESGGYTHPQSANTTYNLTDGDDDFFFLDIKHEAIYYISTHGGTDTWGDLYLDDNGTIKAIAGIGSASTGTHVSILPDGSEFIGNFHMKIVLDPGKYYLRVSHEKEGAPAGTYQVFVAVEKLD